MCRYHYADDGDEDSGEVKFADSMTKEQIIAERGKVESFTYEEFKNGEIQLTHYYGTCFYGYQNAMSETYYYSFIEDKCL